MGKAQKLSYDMIRPCPQHDQGKMCDFGYVEIDVQNWFPFKALKTLPLKFETNLNFLKSCMWPESFNWYQ